MAKKFKTFRVSSSFSSTLQKTCPENELWRTLDGRSFPEEKGTQYRGLSAFLGGSANCSKMACKALWDGAMVQNGGGKRGETLLWLISVTSRMNGQRHKKAWGEGGR